VIINKSRDFAAIAAGPTGCRTNLQIPRPYRTSLPSEATKGHATSTVLVIIAPEIVCMQKEKDSAAGLVANPAGLFRRSRFGQQ
jgi:hypothetical protein